MERDYQAGIARARREESESRARRKALRNEQQERVLRSREAHARRCFLSDVRFHIARRSIAEENVMYTLRNTAACWADVCDRAITRQLNIEAAQRDHAQYDAAYLQRTRDRELQEQLNTEESDTTRWRELNTRRAAEMRDACTEAVRDTIDAVWSHTALCLAQLHQCRLDHAGTELLVALAGDALLLPTTSAEGKPLRSSAAATKEAFQRIFNGSPYTRSSPAFVALLQYCYAQHHVAVPLANVLHLCPIPIVAVDGPKYSGKTLLTNFLKSRYNLLCISDESLVQRALQAAQSPEEGAEEGEEEGNGSSTAAEWVAHGQRIRDELLAGGAVSAATVIELLYLSLKELQRTEAAGQPYDALLLEGVFRSADTYRAVARRFHTLPTHPYASLRRWWAFAPLLDAGGKGAVTQPSANTDDVVGAAAAAAVVDIPDVLRLQGQLTFEHDSPAKQETKARPMKKVDLAALPPPELPEVKDTTALQQTERLFVAQANEELASLPTVLSGVLHIQCSPEEVFRRFAGLRLDLETGEVYHLTYNPPPAERLPHVVNLGRPDVASVELHEAVFHHREEWAAVQRWLSRQAAGSVFARVHELAGDGPVAEVQQDALLAVEQMLSNFRVSRQVMLERDASAARLAVLEAAERAQTSEREGERLRLAAVYTEKGVALPPLLQTPAEGTSSSVAAFGTSAATVVLQAVADFTEEYEEEYGALWQRTTQLTKLLLEYFNGTEEQVAAYWSRPDDKQMMLQRYQNCLDAVPAQLRAQAACKAELHLSLDDLDDALHHCIELRDAEARGLIDALCSPASFLAGWETLVCQDFMRLLQCEADRFLLVLHLFTFFFSVTTGEPLAFDEVEIDMPALVINPADRTAHTSAMSADAVPSSANLSARSTKEKRATASKKTHGKAAEELSEKSVEEQFGDAVQGVLSGVASVTDRLKGMLDAQAKGQKRTGGGGGSGASSSASGAATAHFSHVTAKCLELMEAERAVTASRVAAVHTCVQTLLREAETHAQQRRSYLEASLVAQMAKEAAAVNTAVYTLRGCVESEEKSPKMHLGCTTFATVSDGLSRPTRPSTGSADAPPHQRGGLYGSGTAPPHRSFLTDVPLASQLRDPQLLLHPGLPAARLLELIGCFRCVAPDYQLSRLDFLVLVREGDYAEAVATRLDTTHMVTKSCEELFHAFDPHRCGFLDWRELVVHLLLWVVPAPAANQSPSAASSAQKSQRAAPAGLPEMTLQDLVDTRRDLGYDPLTEEHFFDLPFFYDRHLDDLRLEAYTRVLWCTFCDPKTNTVDPFVLLGFLCADPQPVRGAQKAFQLLSPPEAGGRLTLEEMDVLCHLKATNARAMNQADPCSKVTLRLLFGAATTVSFEDVCLSPIGRKMLNHADLFRRRTFVKRK